VRAGAPCSRRPGHSAKLSPYSSSERIMCKYRHVVAAVLLTFAAVPDVHGQGYGGRFESVSISAGVSQFDLAGTGTAPAIVIRYDHNIGSAHWLLGDASLTIMRPEEQLVGRRTYAISEAQVHFQIPAAVVRPYIGFGPGWLFPVSGAGHRRGQLSTSGAGGIRVVPDGPLAFRVELRIRAIGSAFESTTVDWTAGVGWRL
jgi:hypothetical protein